MFRRRTFVGQFLKLVAGWQHRAVLWRRFALPVAVAVLASALLLLVLNPAAQAAGYSITEAMLQARTWTFAQAQTFVTGLVFSGPLVTGTAPNYREIVVDPNGVKGAYTTIQAAIDYALPRSAVSTPWTIRLLPGIYEQTATLNADGAQYLSFIGAGMDATIINRATALDDSDNSYSSLTRDPVLRLSNSVGCRVMNLTVRHQGTPQVTPTIRRPTALSINEASGFRGSNARFLSTYTGISSMNVNVPANYSEAVENACSACQIKVVGPDDSVITAADTLWVTNQYFLLLNSYTTMESNWQGPDTLRFDGAYIRVIGGYHSRVYTGAATFPNNSSSGFVLNAVTTVNGLNKIFFDGAHLDLLFPGTPTINGSLIDVFAAQFNNSSNVDHEATFTGCTITWQTPTIALSRTAGGVSLLSPPSSGNGTLGSVRFIGSTVRNTGGSGGTLRGDVIVAATAQAANNRIAKAVYSNGSNIGTLLFRVLLAGGNPTLTGDYGKAEPSMNRMTGTVTFASAATAAVTLPIAYGVAGTTNISDYSVAVEPAASGSFSTSPNATVCDHVDVESPSTSTDRWLQKAPLAETITSVNCLIDPNDSGESVVIGVQKCDGTGATAGDNCVGVDGATTITCDNDGAADDGSLSAASITSGQWLSLDVGTVTGTVTRLAVTYCWTQANPVTWPAEGFWVTAKTSTGFTINSSNPASTATVRYTVTR